MSRRRRLLWGGLAAAALALLVGAVWRITRPPERPVLHGVLDSDEQTDAEAPGRALPNGASPTDRPPPPGDRPEGDRGVERPPPEPEPPGRPLLEQMESDYQRLLEATRAPGPAATRAEAWRRFLETYAADLPGDEDDALRQSARQHLRQWRERSGAAPRPADGERRGEDVPLPAASAREALRRQGVQLERQSLMRAAEEGDSRTLRLLVQAQGPYDLHGEDGRRALERAVAGGHLLATRILLQAGATPVPSTVERAVLSHQWRLAEALLAGYPGRPTLGGALLRAAAGGDVTAARWLLDRRLVLRQEVMEAMEAALEAGRWRMARVLSAHIRPDWARLAPQLERLLVDGARAGDGELVRWVVATGAPRQRALVEARRAAEEAGHDGIATLLVRELARRR